MSAVVHAGLLTARAYRGTVRIPVFAVMNLVQPMIWLLLFGQLFRSVVEIPGFAAPGDSYLEFIAPGVVMMTAMFGAAWAGTSFVQDMDRGVMDRLLASPASRAAMLVSTMAWYAVIAVVQGLVVLAVAWLGGARFDGGPLGIAVLFAAVVLLTCLFAAMSNAFALLARSQEALIGLSQLIVLPLMFLSSAVMDTRLSAGWVADAARFNPFDWAVVAGREALTGSADWGLVGSRLGLLAAAVLVMTWLATGAFRAYRASA
ncbi:ABC-2 type transport system permease protein [Promicromonospora sp. AC04]|uniref:ABC transporter permease n=1 Tax=Promicromonospora sp. AC04 TaxID=2135723 RepID=UPI000D3B9F29|nr:ABC transporter permease [Promicromonospora sp. AC04]PUB27891.1 ABC-2 type transport system permease protein [Promicromonospora sp. AC04]